MHSHASKSKDEPLATEPEHKPLVTYSVGFYVRRTEDEAVGSDPSKDDLVFIIRYNGGRNRSHIKDDTLRTNIVNKRDLGAPMNETKNSIGLIAQEAADATKD